MLGTPHDLTTVLARRAPKVTLLDTAESTSALTIYTFSNVSCGSLGGVASLADTYGTHPCIRSSTKCAIGVIVHGTDDAITFDVTSVTLGGVSGTERVDRGGTTNAVNSAMYTWTTDSLQNITNTDVVVTWSEAVTGCAIGVVLIENIGVFAASSNGLGGSSTGGLAVGTTPAITSCDINMLQIWVTTLAATGETVTIVNGSGSSTSTGQCYSPTLLYERANANFSYAAAWTWTPGYMPPATLSNTTISWSGAGVGDGVTVLFF